jgi:predicted  nucleic acid-binding Zn-ribbon protein
MSNAPKTDDQAKLLVALQDIDHMLKEVAGKPGAELKEMGFNIDGVEAVKEARARLAERIPRQLLNRYERVSKSYDRTVVPVVQELCTGCFAKIPTSFRYEKNAVMTCESCGRILYFA